MDFGIVSSHQVQQNIREHAYVAHQRRIASLLQGWRLRKGNRYFKTLCRFFIFTQNYVIRRSCRTCSSTFGHQNGRIRQGMRRCLAIVVVEGLGFTPFTADQDQYYQRGRESDHGWMVVGYGCSVGLPYPDYGSFEWQIFNFLSASEPMNSSVYFWTEGATIVSGVRTLLYSNIFMKMQNSGRTSLVVTVHIGLCPTPFTQGVRRRRSRSFCSAYECPDAPGTTV
jgi:hypothetical protein